MTYSIADDEYNASFCLLLSDMEVLRTYRVDAPHEWCGRLARMVRRVKHIVIYRQGGIKLKLEVSCSTTSNVRRFCKEAR